MKIKWLTISISELLLNKIHETVLQHKTEHQDEIPKMNVSQFVRNCIQKELKKIEKDK